MVPWLFDWRFFLEHPELNKTFDVALHIGTFVGALVYFRRDVARYLGAWWRSVRRRQVGTADERLAWALVVATIPGAVVGAVAEDLIEDHLGQVWLIAVMLAVFGALLFVVDRRARHVRPIEDLGIRDAVLVGLAQAVALQPGVSRSGVTITAARALGLTREAAARFSFLLLIPITGGAGVFKGLGLIGEGLPPGTAGPFLWGMLASAVSGFVVIWLLLAYLRRRTFAPFAIYRLAAASLILGLIAAGVRPAAGT